MSVHCPRLNDNELLVSNTFMASDKQNIRTNLLIFNESFQRLLSSYGDVRSFQIEGGDWPPKALVEYHDIRKAASAKATLEDLHRQVMKMLGYLIARLRGTIVLILIFELPSVI